MTPIDAVHLSVTTLPDPYGNVAAQLSAPAAARNADGGSFASVLREKELRQAAVRAREQAEAWRGAVLSDALEALGSSPVSGDSADERAALGRLLATGGAQGRARLARVHGGYQVAARAIENSGRRLEDLSAALAGAGI